jgi:hypothetical protein
MAEGHPDFYRGLDDFIRFGDPRGLSRLFAPGFDPAIAAVYRNGFYRSCREVLANTYSSVHHVLGAEMFAGVARGYIDRHPPQRGTLTGYGDRFSDWLLSQSAQPSWLADMARLDWAWLDCLHGANAYPIGIQSLQALQEEGGDIADTDLVLLPNVQLLTTSTQIFSLWTETRAGKGGWAATPSIVSRPQRVLFWRPELEVYVRLLSRSEWLFFDALVRKPDLYTAASEVLESYPDYDLQKQFSDLLQNGLLQMRGEVMP